MSNEPFSPSADIKVNNPASEGNPPEFEHEPGEFNPFEIEGAGKSVNINQPGGEGGTAG